MVAGFQTSNVFLEKHPTLTPPVPIMLNSPIIVVTTQVEEVSNRTKDTICWCGLTNTEGFRFVCMNK